MDLTLDQVKEFFETNKESDEVKAYLQGFKQIGVEEVQNLVNDDTELKKWFDSEKDKHFSKGLETWKSNNLESLLDQEIKKRFPEKDEKDIELEKIKSELAKIRTEKQRESLTNKAIKELNQKKLPLELVDYFISDTEEKTIENITKFEQIYSSSIQSLVEERLKNNGVTPKDGEQPKTFTREQISKMSPDEINTNWEEVQKVLSNK